MESKIKTFEEIVRIEPRIAEVIKKARQVQAADWSAYSDFKHQLIPLVGFTASKKELRTCSDYETAITGLCDALNI
jgi:hypothetical protein